MKQEIQAPNNNKKITPQQLEQEQEAFIELYGQIVEAIGARIQDESTPRSYPSKR